VVSADSFDAYYYRHCCGKPYVRNDEWLDFFGQVAGRIVSDISPARVLDAGCALGFLVESLRNRGVDAWGIDISPFAIDQVYAPIKPYCRVGSVTGDLGGAWDLIVSIEVAEHLPPREAEAAIANICAHTTDVLFSSSPVDHREPTHVNVHPPEYWAEQFARHGFFRDVDYDATYVLPWAARFRKRQEPLHRIVHDYERRYWALLCDATDARNYSGEIQRTLAATETERDGLTISRDALQVERDDLVAARDALRAERDDLVAARDALRAERDDLRRDHDRVAVRLNQALDTIAHMERSRFWGLRLAWLRFRRLLSPGSSRKG
jgi:FtsZ-binding cell division protein ZapB